VANARAQVDIVAQDKTSAAINSAKKGLGSLTASAKLVGVALASIGVGVSLRGIASFSQSIVRANDNLRLLDTRLKTFSGSTSGLALAAETARQLGVSLDEAGAGMARLLVVGREIGVTAQEADRLNRTFLQLARLGGSTGAEASGAFIQLTQALGQGVLRGQELNSILAGAPLVAQAIAKELGVSVGELKKLGEQGKITSRVIRDGLANAAAGAAEEFAKLPETLEQQKARIATAWQNVLAGLDAATRQSETYKFLSGNIISGLESVGEQFLPIELLSGAGIDREIRRLETLAARQRQLSRESDSPSGRAKAAQQLLEINEKLDKLRERGRVLNFEAIEAETKTVEATGRTLTLNQALNLSRERALQLVKAIREEMAGMPNQLSAELDRQTNLLPLGTGETELDGVLAVNKALSDGSKEALKELDAQAQRISARFKGSTDQMTAFAEQAARNIQNAFAAFLFDPFKDGLRGMLKGFIDTLRQMIANLAANSVLKSIFGAMAGSGGPFASIGQSLLNGLPGFATGGSFKVGGGGGTDSQLVAFRATPGETVSIRRPGEGGGVVVSPVYNIDARGATMELAKALPGLFAENNRRIAETISQAMSRSGMRAPVF
jgi:tape measure domain-containing protein